MNIKKRYFCCLCFIWLILKFTTPVKAQVILTEVYPQPETDQLEWIELHNNSTQSATLDSWVIMDQLTTPSIIYQFSSQTLNPQEYLVISLSSNKLNNSADGVGLIDQEGNLVDQMDYQNSQAKLSWSKNLDNQLWQLTEPTPNHNNIFPSPSPIASPSPTPTPTPTRR